MSETPKSFKDNFTDFAKNLGSSLNVFKQNVQQAISGVNTKVERYSPPVGTLINIATSKTPPHSIR